MDSSFKLPKIPTIFVEEEPPKRKPQREKQVRRKKNEDESKIQSENVSSESNITDTSKSSVETKESNESNVLPKLELCPACSRVILAYFKPLHTYITDIVKLAETQLKLDLNVNREEGVTGAHLGIEETKAQFSQENYEERDRKQDYIVSPTATNNESMTYVSTVQQEAEKISVSTKSSPEFLRKFETNLSQFTPNLDSFDTTSSFSGNINYLTKDVTENSKEANAFYTETERSSESVDRRETEESGSVDQGKGNETDHQHSQKSGSIISDGKQIINKVDQSIDQSIPTIAVENYENYSHEGERAIEEGYAFAVGNAANSSEIIKRSSGSEKTKSPFAIVTIANSNLAAANAIALVNSFHLTNNNVVFDKQSDSKIFIPFVIILGGNIDPLLKRTMLMIFDEVIYDSGDLRLMLLNDKTLGMKLYKLQLWKALEKYQKCLFLESSTIVVGHITNLLFDCTELSASVDYLFPDYFNCSVFIFCPLSKTYEDLVKFAVSSQVSTGKLNPENHDVVDEMTLLNTFFANKWNRLSFIFNYVQNDSIYSQTPAFLRFGNEIKIVNFGYMGTNLSTLQSSTFVTQPWNIAFDLLTSSQSDKVNTTIAVNNYTQFYLLIFMKRLWPILEKAMMTLLPPPSFGRRNWTVFELIRLLSSKSGQEIEDHMYNQSQITFRRRNSKCNETTPVTPAPETEPAVIISEESNVGNGGEKLSDTTPDEESTAVEPESVDEEVATDPGSQRAAWESGRVDWMGAHRSDSIIERLKGKIDNNS